MSAEATTLALLDPADVATAERNKVDETLARVRLELIEDPDSPAFDQAYRMMDGFFGPRGELESREAIAGFVAKPHIEYDCGAIGEYRLLAAWQGDTMVGVRDCYVDVDADAGVCLVALSHSYVVPDERRSGLAAVLRAVAASIGRRVLTERGLVGDRAPELLVAAEMDPVDPMDPITIVRLLAYGRSGFSVLDPRRLPYSQPDFRMPEGAAHTALPLLPVVRWVGHPDPRSLPASVAAAFPRLFHAAHRIHLPRAWVDPSESHALRALSRIDGPVPVLPLPQSSEDDQILRLAPLLRSLVLPLYPRHLQGERATFDAHHEEAACLLRTWQATRRN